VSWDNLNSELITALLLPIVIWLLTKIAPSKREELKKPIDNLEDFILSVLFIGGFFSGIYFYSLPSVQDNDLWPLAFSLNFSLVLPSLFLKFKYNSLLVGVRSVLAQNANKVSRNVTKFAMSFYMLCAFVTCLVVVWSNVF